MKQFVSPSKKQIEFKSETKNTNDSEIKTTRF